MQPVLEIINLSKNYRDKEAVKDISFKVNQNEMIGILGPNGSGKTTTIGMILGLLKPTKGKILINGIEIEKNRVDLLSKLNFISPYIELPKKLTVRQNLEIYGRLYDVKNLNNKIYELSVDLNLKQFLNKKTGELSSGQKNRVSLAKSIINNPEILFLDEPTASLDPDIGDYVRTYIESYKKRNSVTILLASHNMPEVEKLCDSIIMMKNGKIIDKGTCEKIISKHGRNNLEETFLKLARSKDEI